jgi:Homeodomain-like domain
VSASNNEFTAPRGGDIEHTRRAKVAPLLAVGMSVRAISAETGIPVRAVHRAKRQLEKDLAQGRQKAAAIAQQLPTSYLLKQDIGGVPQDVRRLTVAVYERAVENAIGRGCRDAATETIRGPSSARCSPACSMTTRSSSSTSADI